MSFRWSMPYPHEELCKNIDQFREAGYLCEICLFSAFTDYFVPLDGDLGVFGALCEFLICGFSFIFMYHIPSCIHQNSHWIMSSGWQERICFVLAFPAFVLQLNKNTFKCCNKWFYCSMTYPLLKVQLWHLVYSQTCVIINTIYWSFSFTFSSFVPVTSISPTHHPPTQP